MKTLTISLLSLCAALLLGCGASPQAASTPQSDASNRAEAIFAGGCFWCTEADFDKVPGVLQTTSGYMGGHVPNPTYEQVSAGNSGHIEVVQVIYDTTQTSYAKLLEAFWPTIDPLNGDGQFCDRGPHYRSVIFYATAEERALAEASKAALQASGKLPGDIKTEILASSTFYPAEDYHQDYYQRNPLRYAYYRNGCGRDQRLEQLWGKKG
jgi:peptide-methionine (S)-S-oxide reductase